MIELRNHLALVAALSDPRTLFEVGLIIVLAAAAPLIAQVFRVPSILLHILVADEAMSPDPGDEVIRLVSPTR